MRARGGIKYAFLAGSLSVAYMFGLISGSSDTSADVAPQASSDMAAIVEEGEDILDHRDPVAALSWSIDAGNVEGVRKVLDRAACRPSCAELIGALPLLHRAASNGSAEVINMLLDAGADINLRAAPNGWTPLIQALRSSQIDIARQLVARGADTMVMGADGINAPMLADLLGISEMIPTPPLKLAGPKADLLLLYAIEAGDLKIVEEVVVAGARLETTSPTNGWSALMIAAFNGRVEIVRYLLGGIRAEGINYTEPKGGFNALHAAIVGLSDKGSTTELMAIAQLLTEAGIDPRSLTAKRHDALRIATAQDVDSSVISLLEQAVTRKNFSEGTPVRISNPKRRSEPSPNITRSTNYLTSTDVNLRAQPDASSSILEVIPRGGTVSSTSPWEAQKWILVRVESGRTGYVRADFLLEDR